MKLIPDYPGYSVTQDGKVFSHFRIIRNEKGQIEDKVIDYSIATPVKSRKNCEKDRTQPRTSVILYRNGKKHKVTLARLVAKTYLPNPHNYPSVLHLDDNPSNNTLSNLMWGTNRVNCEQRQQNQKKDLIIKQLKERIKQLEQGEAI